MSAEVIELTNSEPLKKVPKTSEAPKPKKDEGKPSKASSKKQANNQKHQKQVASEVGKEIVSYNPKTALIVIICVVIILGLVTAGFYFLVREKPHALVEGVSYKDGAGVNEILQSEAQDGLDNDETIVFFGSTECPHCRDAIYGAPGDGSEENDTSQTDGFFSIFAKEFNGAQGSKGTLNIYFVETPTIAEAKPEISYVFENSQLTNGPTPEDGSEPWSIQYGSSISWMDFGETATYSTPAIIGTTQVGKTNSTATAMKDSNDEPVAYFDAPTDTTDSDGNGIADAGEGKGIPFIAWFLDGSIVASTTGYDRGVDDHTYGNPNTNSYDNYIAITNWAFDEDYVPTNG